MYTEWKSSTKGKERAHNLALLPDPLVPTPMAHSTSFPKPFAVSSVQATHRTWTTPMKAKPQGLGHDGGNRQQQHHRPGQHLPPRELLPR